MEDYFCSIIQRKILIKNVWKMKSIPRHIYIAWRICMQNYQYSPRAGFIGFAEAKFDNHMADKWECKVLNVESQI
jgi:hypothetical protein